MHSCIRLPIGALRIDYNLPIESRKTNAKDTNFDVRVAPIGM